MLQKNSFILIIFITLFSNIFSSEIIVGFLTSWKQKCGIGMYTEHIYQSLINNGFISFGYNYNTPLPELITRIRDDKIKVLNIQYEPTFFSIEKLTQIIDCVKKEGIKVVVTVHWEIDQIREIFNKVDQFIYHKSSNIFKATDYKFNLIPMGIPVFKPQSSRTELRKKYGFDKNHLIITTVGFMLPWKDFSGILKLLCPIIKVNKNVRIQLLTSYNDLSYNICYQEDKKIKNIIKNYNLKKQVIHITDFLTQKEYAERLWISDIGYLWGNLISSATSASSKEFISARLPLIVTNSTHFHDINSGVVKVPTNESIFVSEILKSCKDKKKLKILKAQLQIQYQKLNYDNLIGKYVEVYKKALLTTD